MQSAVKLTALPSWHGITQSISTNTDLTASKALNKTGNVLFAPGDHKCLVTLVVQPGQKENLLFLMLQSIAALGQ